MSSISLQKQLIKSTVMISLVVGLLGFVMVGLVVGISQSRVYDELLASNAWALLGDGDGVHPDIEYSLRYLNDEMDIEYQVLNGNGTLINKTLNAPDTPYLQAFDDDAYYNIYHQGQFWRIYSAYELSLNRYVQIAQPWEQRLEYALPIALNYAALMVALLLVLVLGNAWVIRRSLNPLKTLKNEIHQKHLQDLSPIAMPIHLVEIQPLVNAINQLFERLITAKENQEHFIADASHELRTPLAAIQMKLQLLQRKFAQTPTLASDIHSVQGDIERATAMVESLLMLTRLDNEADKTMHDILVLEWLDDVVDLMSPNFDKVGATLLPTYRTHANLQNLKITANRELLFVALRNLLDNALRYGGHQISVQIDIKQHNHQLILMVKDNGVGVTADERLRLSQRFFRVLGSQKTGSGLGLSIVAKIAEYHGGKLWFDEGLDGKGLGVYLSINTLANTP